VAEYFLKLDGIAGESADAKHKDEIELVSFSCGVTQQLVTEGSGGASAGRAQFKDFEFTKKVDKASPQIFLATVSGKHIKEASLSVRRAAKVALEYLKIKFTDVIVTSYLQAGGADAPQEVIAFDFRQIQLEQSSGEAATPVQIGWNLAENLKI
jgi:type VI secretion system secreted protein Hcp